MASHKRSARERQRAAFLADIDDMGDAFDRERRHQSDLEGRREATRRHKACGSKARYATRDEARDAIAACEAHGTRGLSCYRCPYCRGWHLTSHPRSA